MAASARRIRCCATARTTSSLTVGRVVAPDASVLPRITSARTGANRRGSHSDRNTSCPLSRSLPPCSSTSGVAAARHQHMARRQHVQHERIGQRGVAIERGRSAGGAATARQTRRDPRCRAIPPLPRGRRSACVRSRQPVPDDAVRRRTGAATDRTRGSGDGRWPGRMSAAPTGAATSRRKRSERSSSWRKLAWYAVSMISSQRPRRRAAGPPTDRPRSSGSSAARTRRADTREARRVRIR